MKVDFNKFKGITIKAHKLFSFKPIKLNQKSIIKNLEKTTNIWKLNF
jgi:hypothetical protein